MADPLAVWFCYFPSTGDRYWSGDGSVTYDGETWEGASFIEISQSEKSLGAPNKRLSAFFRLTTDQAYAEALQDPGPLQVQIDWVVSEDHGQTWTKVRRVIGKLSAPKIGPNDVYTIEVETYAGDADRGNPLYWSHEHQKAAYPDDEGFEHMASLSAGIKGTWPQ